MLGECRAGFSLRSQCGTPRDFPLSIAIYRPPPAQAQAQPAQAQAQAHELPPPLLQPPPRLEEDVLGLGIGLVF